MEKYDWEVRFSPPNSDPTDFNMLGIFVVIDGKKWGQTTYISCDQNSPAFGIAVDCLKQNVLETIEKSKGSVDG